MSRLDSEFVRSRNSGGHSASNSDPTDTFRVIAVGVHTVSFAWRGCPRDVFPSSPTTVSSRTGEVLAIRRHGPRHRIVTDSVSGARIGCSVTPTGYSVWVEGTLSAILADCAATSLAPADGLPRGARAATELARSVGVDIPDTDRATVRRCDLAVDSAFVVPADGLTVLRGVAALNLPRHHSDVHRAPGSIVQSVAWTTGGGIALRVYDKTSEERRGGVVDDPGRVIRVERQHRPRTAKQLPADEYCAQDLAAMFAHPLSSWSDERIVIASPAEAYWIIKGLVGRPVLSGGRVLSGRVAERMMGSLMQLSAEGDAAWPNRRTALRRRRELRSVGVEVDTLAASVIELGAFFRTVSAAWEATHPGGQRLHAEKAA
jgi:hypothetical protein